MLVQRSNAVLVHTWFFASGQKKKDKKAEEAKEAKKAAKQEKKNKKR